MPLHLLIGIDTEPDNQWDLAGRQQRTFANVHALPDLHRLLTAHGGRPTYFVTHGVATDSRSADVLRSLAADASCEIAAHHHAWETPPCGADDERSLPYTSMLEVDRFEMQLRTLTETLQTVFGRRPVSYRSGRFGLSAAHVAPLERAGYQVDSSVVPLLNEARKGGPTFVNAPLRPYALGYENVETPGSSRILEVPVSAGLNRSMPRSLARFYGRFITGYQTRRILRLAGIVRVVWLRPSYSPLRDMSALATALRDEGVPVLNVFFHSSEATVGTSPYNQNPAELGRFLDDLAKFVDFAIERLHAIPVTFEELYRRAVPAVGTAV